MRVVINVPQRRVVIHWPNQEPTAHYLTKAGCNRLFLWLMDNGTLLWGWDSGEYVFRVEVQS